MTLCRTFIVALIALLIAGMGMASPVSAADSVVFMDYGKVIVESGAPEQVFEAAETDRLKRFLSQVLGGLRGRHTTWQAQTG
jgi:ABC-type histidine transport system ATPase subunit